MKLFGTCIILAGGKSSRMGFDKQFLKVDKRRLMYSIIQKLEDEFDEIIIVTNKPQHYIGLSQKITMDILKEKGPLGGIHAGLKLAKSQYSFVIACDMPNINLEYMRYMRLNTSAMGCTTRFGNWIEPFGSFYSKEIVPDIESYLKTEKRSINHLLMDLDINYIEEKKAREFSPNWDMFLNLNTQDDLENFLNNTQRESCS
ncbi:molybdenum cofactor guanylyltransferase [Tissierella creatinophila]|uniref:Probable molybdenum cofactor guanylyltransferase n=1 Tax=Tissierella creatinophila DSM 6911 TaxID=1123403 RepID=A0A1U7M921_TISCR|nr:molybdenum cofactor guanylyltransferase [Tissierella creatinophila]OLS03740.1 putative molybdenum cofactor guanylyltransferase [Tissierella creatinophila DSM 6911]